MVVVRFGPVSWWSFGGGISLEVCLLWECAGDPVSEGEDVESLSEEDELDETGRTWG